MLFNRSILCSCLKCRQCRLNNRCDFCANKSTFNNCYCNCDKCSHANIGETEKANHVINDRMANSKDNITTTSEITSETDFLKPQDESTQVPTEPPMSQITSETDFLKPQDESTQVPTEPPMPQITSGVLIPFFDFEGGYLTTESERIGGHPLLVGVQSRTMSATRNDKITLTNDERAICITLPCDCKLTHLSICATYKNTVPTLLNTITLHGALYVSDENNEFSRLFDMALSPEINSATGEFTLIKGNATLDITLKETREAIILIYGTGDAGDTVTIKTTAYLTVMIA